MKHCDLPFPVVRHHVREHQQKVIVIFSATSMRDISKDSEGRLQVIMMMNNLTHAYVRSGTLEYCSIRRIGTHKSAWTVGLSWTRALTRNVRSECATVDRKVHCILAAAVSVQCRVEVVRRSAKALTKNGSAHHSVGGNS